MSQTNSERVTIVGGGLVGSLLGIMLAKRGASVRIFERRPDIRLEEMSAGRSINLALSDRGLNALEVAGVADEIRAIAIPMHGRMMHDTSGNQVFQPYGLPHQAINSVSRGDLNKTLLTVAEHHGVELVFDARCTGINVDTGTASFELAAGQTREIESDVLFGADGAFSAVRGTMQTTDRFTYSQSYLDHSYKELHIPADIAGGFLLEKNALHIWPRHSFMMIALPNIGGSFTVTLFLAHNGPVSFEQLSTRESVELFFRSEFPDAIPLMPSLVDDFFNNPESSLATVKCYPWVLNNRCALIGDAAHAMVPFYGQGMNCGFEDCRVMLECLDFHKGQWAPALADYQLLRKPSSDAISDLAIENFVVMRDKVADPHFLTRKKIEAWIYQHYPEKFIPLYTMVTFLYNIPYSEARRIGSEQELLMDGLMLNEDVSDDWTSSAAQKFLHEKMLSMPTIEIASGSPS